MKCDTCKNKKHYCTGRDEYPLLTTIEYCREGHWEDGPQPEPDNIVWDNCKDYEQEGK